MVILRVLRGLGLLGWTGIALNICLGFFIFHNRFSLSIPVTLIAMVGSYTFAFVLVLGICRFHKQGE